MGLFNSKPQTLDGPFSHVPLSVVQEVCGNFPIPENEIEEHFKHYFDLPSKYLKPLTIKPWTRATKLWNRLDLIVCLINVEHIDLTKPLPDYNNELKRVYHVNSWIRTFLEEWNNLPEDIKKNSPLSENVAQYCQVYKDWADSITSQSQEIKDELKTMLNISVYNEPM